MKILVPIVASCLALTGCATATQQQILTNLEGCTRHYDGAVSGGITGAGFVGTVKIDCGPAHAEPGTPQ